MEINKAQFYQSLADSMMAKLLPDSDKDLCKAIEMLDLNSLSENMQLEFDEAELKYLYAIFPTLFKEMKGHYRDFKDSRRARTALPLTKLLNFVNTIPLSTAECE